VSQDFGPFSVDPAQVVGPGGALFQNLVSRLLAAEVASAGMAGSDLHTSYQDNIGDQGVDAGIYAAIKTEWIPAGDSAWQFKAGDLSPKSAQTNWTVHPEPEKLSRMAASTGSSWARALRTI
jgi:hypothetical protein